MIGFTFYKNIIIRARCSRILHSFEELNRISVEDKVNLLKSNLVRAEMFALVHAFNKPTWEEELNFLLGNEDKLYWMTCHHTIQGVPLSTMITSSPLSELKKLELYNTFSCCKSQDGLLSDSVVFYLTLLIILLTPDDKFSNQLDVSVTKVQNRYETLLMNYLQQQRGPNIDSDMKIIYNCIQNLPKIAYIFGSMQKTDSP